VVTLHRVFAQPEAKALAPSDEGAMDPKEYSAATQARQPRSHTQSDVHRRVGPKRRPAQV